MRSPVPYFTDEKFSALPVTERALLEAKSQIGVEEVPRGSNWGPMVKVFLRAAGLAGPAPWCAAFVTWCLVIAGVQRSKLPLASASTAAWIKWAWVNHRFYTSPKRGDLFVWNDQGKGHIGFVADVYPKTGKVRTIEGNTNDGGSREGFAVCERKRTIESIVHHAGTGGFISLTGVRNERSG